MLFNPNCSLLLVLGRSFFNLFSRLSFLCSLLCFGFYFSTLLVPFDSLRPPFDSLLVPIWLPLVRFRSLWLPFTILGPFYSFLQISGFSGTRVREPPADCRLRTTAIFSISAPDCAAHLQIQKIYFKHISI